jgi:hypothetical protein
MAKHYAWPVIIVGRYAWPLIMTRHNAWLSQALKSGPTLVDFHVATNYNNSHSNSHISCKLIFSDNLTQSFKP